MPFHERGRKGKRQVQRRFLRKRGAAGTLLLGASGLNSFSQSLTALPAPSGREPLARPHTLHFSRKLSRHAKGPILEGAVERMRDWGSLLPGLPLQSLLRKASSPKGEPLGAAGNFPAAAEAVPLGKVAATNGSRRKGFFAHLAQKGGKYFSLPA